MIVVIIQKKSVISLYLTISQLGECHTTRLYFFGMNLIIGFD